MIKEWKRNGKSSIKGKIGILFLIGLFTSFTGGSFGGVSFNFGEQELSSEKEKDAFGHAQLSGTGKALEELVSSKLKLPTRSFFADISSGKTALISGYVAIIVSSFF